MKILLLGKGGREHALAWKLAESPLCKALYIAPGNPGTAKCGFNAAIRTDDTASLKKLIADEEISMVISGPETPLVEGLRDDMEKDTRMADVIFIGPGAAGARLEGSKAYAKEFMKRHNIPTASYGIFADEKPALDFLNQNKPPYVIKADGLAAGKGVVITSSVEEAGGIVSEMLSGKLFGNAGSKVVIEEFLSGQEISIFLLVQGNEYILLPAARDYKRAGDGNTGMNTGGMGSVSGPGLCSDAFLAKVSERIIRPTINGLSEEDIPYEGFLFIGIMDVEGSPYVIEYNVRLGDPETESVLPRIKSDLVRVFNGMVNGCLSDISLDVSDEWAVTVMLASGGYPGRYQSGNIITGLENIKHSRVFHAGTAFGKAPSEIVTSGGRVMALCCTGKSLQESIARCMEDAAAVQFNGKHYRSDIGRDILKILQ